MSGLFKSRSSTTTQDPMQTAEQKQAMQMLSQLAQTGQFGDINLGEAYTGSLGDFNMTGTESLAGNKLLDLLQAGTPQGITTARNTLTGLAQNTFNPDDPSSGYAAYARQVARSTGEANDALNRDAAVTGDRFSTSLGRDKVDLRERQSDILASKLGELFNAGQNRALSAAQGLSNLETQNEAINQGRLESGFNLGSLQRLLNTAEANAKFSEFERQRKEKLSRIGISENVFNKNITFGQMSKTTKAPSIFSSILGQVSPIVGSYNTAKYGADAAPGQASLTDFFKSVQGNKEDGGNNFFSILKALAMGGV